MHSLARALRSAIPVILGSAALSAAAAPLDAQFSGYGTIAATFADTKDAEFRSSLQQARGSRSRVDWGVDSRLGVQLDVAFDDTFSATGQVLVQRTSGAEKLSAEWLYGQAQLNPETVLRVGRMVLTTFMLSDVRNIGYSQHWVHTPYEVYLTFPQVDGAQLLYRTTWEGIKIAVQPSFGRAEADTHYEQGPAGLATAHSVFGKLRTVHVMAEKGDWTARLGHMVTNARLEWKTQPVEPVRYAFSSFGLQYDNGHFMAMAEMMVGNTDTKRYDIAGQYVTGGYRLGAWMPYVTYAHLSNRGTVIRVLPPSRTHAAGIRWDAFKDVAIKAQAERAPYAGQQFIRAKPGIDVRQRANVYTLAVDFVF
jgi:hypothetical protein